MALIARRKTVDRGTMRIHTTNDKETFLSWIPELDKVVFEHFNPTEITITVKPFRTERFNGMHKRVKFVYNPDAKV